jgi:O-antigen/teichoic acid export membrane protein
MPFLRYALLVLLMLMATTGFAHAYIDGGSAHLIIQGLIAAAVGALYYLRNPKEIWRAIKRRFGRDRS